LIPNEAGDDIAPRNLNLCPRFLKEKARGLTSSAKFNRSQLLARWTDISQGGLFIQTMHPLPVGQQLKLKIRLPSGSKLDRAIGVVRHRLEWGWNSLICIQKQKD
jgi:hypothetical protein